MGKLVPPPPVLMSLNPNINSDLAVGAVITEFFAGVRAQVEPLISRRHCLRSDKKVHVYCAGRSYRVYSPPERTKNSKLYQIDVKIFVPPLF